jgi:hypothetical protein
MREATDPGRVPEDLREAAERLHCGRPSWTPTELDGIKLRAMKRAAGAARSRSPIARLLNSALFTQMAIGAALIAIIALIRRRPPS